MNKKITAVLVIVLCMAIAVAFGMTVSATEGDGSSSSVVSASSEDSSTSSTEQTSSDVSADSSTDETSSEEGTSSEGDTSSDEEASSEEGSTSSETTSSKPHKPITSGGNPDSNKFVDETGSQLASENVVSTDDTHDDDLISNEYEDGVDEELDEYYEGDESGFVADDIYKVIWIPITIAVLCIVGLIVVNVMFKKKYPKAKSGAASNSKTSGEAPRRRSRK